MTHTLGKWETGYYKTVPTVFSAQGNGTLSIATVWDSYIEKNTAEANARLIAAAPDLLEALSDAVNCWDQPLSDYSSRMKPCIDAARIAIKKATEEA